MPSKRKVVRTNKNGVKTKQVIKDGVIKKTVTRTKGGVEKEIERGNKRIEVQKYKDEGVKSRTVINMKKNNQYNKGRNKLMIDQKTGKGYINKTPVSDLQKKMIEQSKSSNADLLKESIGKSIKNSTFKNIPKQMYDNANSSKNTQIDGKISESKPLTTPQKKMIAMPYEILKGTLDKMSTDGGFKTTKTTGKAIPQLKSKLTIIKKNK